jgi:hypothetical protein
MSTFWLNPVPLSVVAEILPWLRSSRRALSSESRKADQSKIFVVLLRLGSSELSRSVQVEYEEEREQPSSAQLAF